MDIKYKLANGNLPIRGHHVTSDQGFQCNNCGCMFELGEEELVSKHKEICKKFPFTMTARPKDLSNWSLNSVW